MTEENENTEEEQASGGGKPWLLIALVALLCLGAGAGGAFFLLGGGDAAPATPENTEAAGGENGAAEGELWADRVLALEPFVVNVSDDGYGRYLKLKLELQADSSETVAELDARLAQVRDTVILLLSSKRLADISDFEGKALLKDDLRERVNALLEKGGRVEQVLFTDFVVQ